MRSLTPDEELQFQACVAKHYTEEPVARGDVTGTPAPDTRMFPLLDGPREIPWSVIAPFAGQAERNHGQTLANLAGRGGLSVKEALHVMLCVEWSRSKESARITALSDRDATLELTALVAKTSRPDLTGETPPAAAERVGKGPNGSHRCPVCGAFCVCAEWYDGAPCEHRVHSGCQSGGGPPPETPPASAANDTTRLDWLRSNCCAVVLRDDEGEEWTFERDYFSDDGEFRAFLDQLAAEYEFLTDPLHADELGGGPPPETTREAPNA